MIPDQRYAVLESGEVPESSTVGALRLVLFRDPEGRSICLKDRCAHRGFALSGGTVLNGEIPFPFHSLRYDSTGQYTIILANEMNESVPERYSAW